jgi:type II secretory pathway pseudopilin PulG
MAALLVGLGVMSILLSAAMPVWHQQARREKEEELIFRGTQYARAIGLFQRKYANAFPPSIDVLVQQKFLRKKYKDPMSKDGEFQVLYQTMQAPGATPGSPGQPGSRGPGGSSTIGAQPTGMGSGAGAQPGGIGSTITGSGSTIGPRGGMVGVASKSKDQSIRIYNGRNHYNEWQFVYVPQTMQPGAAPGAVRPGMPGTGGPGGIGGPARPGGTGPRSPRGPGSNTGFPPPQRPPRRGPGGPSL